MYSEFFFARRTLPCHAGVALRKQKSVKMLINLHLSKAKTANISVMQNGSIMIFGGILEGVFPINNHKKYLLCDFRCQSESGKTGFFTHLYHSTCIYKPSQVEDVVL